MKHLRIVGLTAMLLVTVLLLGYGQQTAEQLLQSGQYKEEVQGELDAAIEIYREIVLNHSDNRGVAAKALVQLGRCYEKLGSSDAMAYYQQVELQYADQREQAAIARSKLAGVTRWVASNPISEMTIRRIWEEAKDVSGTPSPDGRYITFVDWDTGDLAIHEFETGKDRLLTNKGSWYDSLEFAYSSVFSPDGKRIAYAWWNKGFSSDLRMVHMDGSNQRVLLSDEEIASIHPADWSPDGKNILAELGRKDGTSQIVFISATSGSVRVLKDVGRRVSLNMSFSPDGRYFVYDLPPTEDSEKSDVFLMAADGSRDVPLVEHDGNDFSPQWAPDGKSVVFASDRTGTTGLWAIRVVKGVPQGYPVLIKPDLVQGSMLLGFDQEGSLYYGYQNWLNTGNVYMAGIDVSESKLSSSPKRVTQNFVGFNTKPAWSPDGKYLAYIVSPRTGTPLARRTLVIRDIETGKERKIQLRRGLGSVHSETRWSPDGRSILVQGRDEKSQSGLYSVDVNTGAVTRLVEMEPGTFAPSGMWSSDGKTIFYLRSDTGTKSMLILARDLETGKDKELFRGLMSEMAVSPDNANVSFTKSDPKTQAASLAVMPIKGGEAREVYKGDIHLYGWTPDGEYLLAGIHADADAPLGLYLIPAKGGKPQSLGLTMDELRDVRIHPDGTQIAFTAGKFSSEIWVMENFLPERKSEQKSASKL